MNRRELLHTIGGATISAGIGNMIIGETLAQETPNPRIVDEMATPTGDTRCITSDGQTIWTGHGEASGEAIYEMEPNGRIINTLSFSGPNCPGTVQANLIAVTGDQIYVVGRGFEYASCSNTSFFIINRDSLEKQNTYNIDDQTNYQGLAADREYVYFGTPSIIKKSTPATNLVRSIRIPGSQDDMSGLAFDGDSFWVGGKNLIRKVSRDGNELAKFSYPRGCCVDDIAHDGEYLWLVQDDTTLLKLNTSVETATPTPRQPSQNEDRSDRETTTQGVDKTTGETGPGFGIISTLGGVAGGAYLIKNRFSDEK